MSKIEQFEQQDIQKKFFRSAVCPEGNPCIHLCAAEECTEKSALICSTEDCKICRINHEDCFKVEPQSTFKKIQKKILNCPQLTEKIEKFVIEATDWISEYGENVRTLGLNRYERNLYNWINRSKWSKIKGVDVSNATENLKNIDKIGDAQKLVKQLDDCWAVNFTKIREEFRKMDEVVRSNLRIDSLKTLPRISFEEKTLKSTTMLTQKKDFWKLLDLLNSGGLNFQNKSTKMSLIFRASENKFSLEQFYSKCSDIAHTVILIKTEHDKVVGCYNPLTWNKGSNLIQAVADGKRAFLFSLTNNCRQSTLNNGYLHVTSSQTNGLRMVGNNNQIDLMIVDQAQIDKKNVAMKHSYNASNMNQYPNFTGSSNEYFQIKEWEVFTIEELKNQVGSE